MGSIGADGNGAKGLFVDNLFNEIFNVGTFLEGGLSYSNLTWSILSR